MFGTISGKFSWTGKVQTKKRKTMCFTYFPWGPPEGPKPGPCRAQAGPQVGPSSAQARFLEIWKSGNWKSGNLRSKTIKKIQILKIKIRSAQNIGKVQISRNKSSWPLWGHFRQLCPRAGKMQKKTTMFAFFPGWANGRLTCSRCKAEMSSAVVT